ncbi:MAG TPA: metallophosphoesterase family protein [Kiritimatiellia bacterium]|nr:metallophosphoesterase family protein [Kiritimatiellia bacterium]HRT29496.1 metallophosphoesterase family protein [Kiritimatiellia bacterium]
MVEWNGDCWVRRDFLKAGLAGATVFAVDWRAWAAEEKLPAYYGEHLASVAQRIRELSKTCPDGFFFITDIHVPANRCVSGRLLAQLITDTGVKKVVCGGDMPEAFGGKASVDNTIAKYRELWVGAVESAGGEFYPARGNHDFTIRDSPEASSGFTYPNKPTRDILMDTAAVRQRAVVNTDDPEACYYYADFPERRMRYIVADTSDRVREDRTFWAVEYGMQERQLHWLAERALGTLADGWSAIVVNHIPITTVVGGESGNSERFAPWRKLLEAYQGRGKASVGDKEYDFAHAKGFLICNLTGHAHAERQTYQNGLWHITEPCDAAYSDYIVGSTPWCPELPRKEKGTIFEQTFDAVQVDVQRRRLHFTRLGGGGDRTYHLDARCVKVGEDIKLATKFSGSGITWGCYDADRVSRRQNPANKYQSFYSYFNDRATVSSDGVLTTKAPGEVVVIARSADGVKEIFPMQIV